MYDLNFNNPHNSQVFNISFIFYYFQPVVKQTEFLNF